MNVRDLVLLALATLATTILGSCRMGSGSGGSEPDDAASNGAAVRTAEAPDTVEVHVRVRARGLEQAEVDLGGRTVRVLDRRSGEEVARGVTNLSGKAPITVPRALFTQAAKEKDRFVAVVGGPGIRGRASPVFHGALGMGERRLARIDVERGASFCVRLVDGEGEPIEGGLEGGAVAAEFDSIGPRPVAYHRVDDGFEFRSGRTTVVALGGGVHLLNWSGAELPRRLHFDVPDVGTGALDVDATDLERELWPARDVALGGAASIVGRVLDGRGDPIADLPVVATWSASSRPGDVVTSGWRPEWPEREDPRAGRILARALTDGDGRFEMKGLEEREFILFVSNPMASEGGREWRERARTRAAAEPRAVRIVRRGGKIDVAVRGPDGATVALDLHVAGFADGAVWARDLHGAAPSPARSETFQLEGGHAQRTYHVPGDSAYIVAGTIEGGSFQAEPLLLEGEDGAASVTLDLTEARGTGDIVVTVRGTADGGADLHPTEFVVLAADVETAVPVGRYRDSGGREGPAHAIALGLGRLDQNPVTIRDVPAGPVRVSVAGVPPPLGMLGTGDRRHGRAEAIIDVTAGEQRAVELELGRGGFLEVEVRGEIRPGDEEALARTSRWFDDESIAERFLQGFLDAQITLVDPGGRASFPVLRIGTRDIRAVHEGRVLLGNWPLGETHTSTMLPAGTYTLQATQVTRDTVRRPVTITPGETTRVVLDFGGG